MHTLKYVIRCVWEGIKGFLMADSKEPECYWGFGLITGFLMVFFITGVYYKSDGQEMLQQILKNLGIYLGIILGIAILIDLIRAIASWKK